MEADCSSFAEKSKNLRNMFLDQSPSVKVILLLILPDKLIDVGIIQISYERLLDTHSNVRVADSQQQSSADRDGQLEDHRSIIEHPTLGESNGVSKLLDATTGITATLELFSAQIKKHKIIFEEVLKAFHLKLLGMPGNLYKLLLAITNGVY